MKSGKGMKYSSERATTGIGRLVRIELVHIGDRGVSLVEGVPTVDN